MLGMLGIMVIRLVLVVAWLVKGLLGVRRLPVPRLQRLSVWGSLAAVEGVTAASFVNFLALIMSMTEALLQIFASTLSHGTGKGMVGLDGG